MQVCAAHMFYAQENALELIELAKEFFDEQLYKTAE